MRIFFPNASIKHPPTAGSAIHRYQLIKNLVELGHEVHTLIPDENPRTIKHPKSPWPVLQQVRAADAIYCRLEIKPNAATDLTLPRSRWLIPRRTAVVWELNVSLEYSLRDDRTSQEVQQAIARFRRAARRVDAAICVTRQLADEARQLLGIRQTHVVQNGSDPEMFRRDLPKPDRLEISPGSLHVVFIGSGAEAYHDTPLICGAAELAARQQLPIEFHIIGKTEQLFPGKLAPNVHRYGPVSYLELPRYLAAMDVGLVLYKMRADGLSPLKLFDYLASGCVPICSESQPMCEVLQGTDAGLIGQWNPQSLCQALLQFHHDPNRLAQMRRAGRGLIEGQYSWRSIAEKTVQIIEAARRD